MLELLHRHVIHARRSAVGLHACEGLPQIRQGVGLIHQAEPFASQHSLFESRQHPFRPDFRFDPSPSSPNLSGGTSPSGHCVRELLRLFRHVSTSLRSLRSRPVTALPRYYGRSDSCPCRRDSARVLPGGRPFGSSRAGLPDSRSWPSVRSLSIHVRVPGPLGHAIALRSGQTPWVSGAGLRSFIRRLAVSRPPNRVRSPRDRSFTSCCSPPRLAATQLQAGYSLALDSTGEDFHLSDQVRFQAHGFPLARE